MKKFLLLTIITALSLSLAYLPPATAADLSDIAGTQFEKQIQKLVESGVVAGFPDGSFKPDQEVTRAQFAKLAAVALNLSPSGYTQSIFTDVPADHWALGFIEAVAAKGWVKGYPDGTFGPEKSITREEMATMVVRVLGREEEGKTYQEAFVQANDCARVSEWAYGPVTLAYHSDVQVLTYHAGRMIDPQTPATRGETANAIYFTMKPPTQGGQLTIGMTQEPAKLYPYHNNMHAKSEILSCILAGGNYSSWIGLAPEGKGIEQKGVYYPIFAQEVPSLENGLVKLNEDGTMEMTWHLRKTPVYWQDGVQVTLDDAVFGHEELLNMAIPADLRDPDDSVTAYEKLDENTLRILYSTEKSTAIAGFNFGLAKHKYEEMVNSNPEGFFRSDVNTYPLGHGPYKIDNWTVGSSMTLVANENYCFGKPPVKQLVWLFIPDASTIYARIASGDLDSTVPGVGVATSTAIDNLNTIPGVVFDISPSSYVEHIEFNLLNYDRVSHPIFNPPGDEESGRLVRQALAYAVNREQAAQELYKGYCSPAISMIPPGQLLYCTADEIGLELIPSFDPEKAKQLLEQAGWKDENGDGVREKNGRAFEVQLSTTNRTDRQQMAAIWQQNFSDVGVKVNLDFKPGPTFFADTWAGSQRGYPDLAEFAWGSNDPRYPNTGPFRGDRVAFPENPTGQNYTGWQNAEFDEQARIVDDKFDLPTAKAAALKSQQIFLRDMPSIPLLFQADATLYKERIQGVQIPNWSLLCWNIADWFVSE